MGYFCTEQARNNRSSTGSWTLAGPHRRVIMGYLAQASRRAQDGSLTVVGAGNCNDLELASCLRLYKNVRLIDVDRVALVSAVRRQLPRHQDRELLTLETRELTGIMDHLDAWVQAGASRGAPMMTELESRISDAPVSGSLPGSRSDVVLVPNVLSQLLAVISQRISKADDRALRLLRPLRRRFIEEVIHLIKPGGVAILALDIVSSDSIRLDDKARSDLPLLSDKLLESGNFFTGCNPYMLENEIEHDFVPDKIWRLQRLDPWLWTMAGPRSYLVHGLVMHRAYD